MKIVQAFPPNIAEIDRVFGVRGQSGVFYCYGDTIFNPDGIYVPPQIIAHEEVHEMQQRLVGGPEAWWSEYLVSADFRLAHELAAHRVEYREFCRLSKNRQRRREYLDAIAGRLSGALYNNLISKQDALKVIERRP